MTKFLGAKYIRRNSRYEVIEKVTGQEMSWLSLWNEQTQERLYVDAHGEAADAFELHDKIEITYPSGRRGVPSLTRFRISGNYILKVEKGQPLDMLVDCRLDDSNRVTGMVLRCNSPAVACAVNG